MTVIVEEKVLEHSDINSLTWLRLKKHFEARLAYLRMQNDGDLDPIATARVRGEIRAVKSSLALGNSPDPAMEADEG